MKFSVLLPTRNGGDLLDQCITSILGQDDEDVELVVSDNANTDRTAEVLAGWRGDHRLKVIRQPTLLSVTENWSAAYAACTGDYVILVGDDDYLLPGYFMRLRQLLVDAGSPECLTYSAYAFVFPGAIDGLPHAHYADPHFALERQLVCAPRISAEQRASIVADMFRFRPRVPLNLQSTVFSRVAAARLPHGLFRAPFPDHYALNGLLMTAGSWACAQDKLLVIGVSLKSFGHFSYSGDSARGLEYLDSEIGFPGALPGNDLITAMYRWLLLLQRDFPLAAGLEVSRGDYVVRQLWDWLRAWRSGTLGGRALLNRIGMLSRADWLGALRLVADAEIRGAGLARVGLKREQRAELLWLGLRATPRDVTDRASFADWVRGPAAAV